jgi:hypothetical protein
LQAVVLVAAHGNSLRALVKHLDRISDADIAGLNIPPGPVGYDLGEDLYPTSDRRQLSDPEAIRKATEAVTRQAALARDADEPVNVIGWRRPPQRPHLSPDQTQNRRGDPVQPWVGLTPG